MGSILRENIIYIKQEMQDELVKKLKDNGYAIYATTLEESNSIEETSLDKKCAFIFGNEANGVSEYFKNISDKNIKIEMSKNIDSLNVSVASGILMYKKYVTKNQNKKIIKK